MDKMTCVICENEYIPKTIRNHTCSENCYLKLRRLLKRTSGGKEKCKCCNKEFRPRRVAKEYFCSQECKSKYGRRLTEIRISKTTKKCIICGDEFHPISSIHKFCSRKCGRKHDVILQKERFQTQGGKEKRRKYEKQLLKRDPQRKISKNLRVLLYYAFKNNDISKHNQKTYDILGYSPEELMIHLEKQFKYGMSWDNIGEWHIDHKKPQSLFSFKSIYDPDFKECWALDNLQPLWAITNMSKGNKYEQARTES